MLAAPGALVLAGLQDGLLRPKAHHMAESDLEYQTAIFEAHHQDSSLIAAFEPSFFNVGQNGW